MQNPYNMQKVNLEQVKQLREETGISLAECRKAVEESGGDLAKAKDLLRQWGKEVAEKKQGREAGEGLIECYVHGTGKIGSLVDVRCETDFVARSADFKKLCHELALQVASMDARDVSELASQPYIRDGAKTVKDLIDETIAKLGENIVIRRFTRFEI